MLVEDTSWYKAVERYHNKRKSRDMQLTLTCLLYAYMSGLSREERKKLTPREGIRRFYIWVEIFCNNMVKNGIV